MGGAQHCNDSAHQLSSILVLHVLVHHCEAYRAVTSRIKSRTNLKCNYNYFIKETYFVQMLKHKTILQDNVFHTEKVDPQIQREYVMASTYHLLIIPPPSWSGSLEKSYTINK